MLLPELTKKTANWINILYVISVVLVAIISAVIKIDLSTLPSWLPKQLFSSVINNAWWILLIVLVISSVFQMVSFFKMPGRIWSLVQTLLNDMRSLLFPQVENPHYFRLTLYKHSKRRLLSTISKTPGWLIPVARSGFVTKTGIPSYWAPTASPDSSEGFVGLTWKQHQDLEVHDLPDLNNPPITDPDLLVYSQKTNVSIQWIKKRLKKHRPFPRALRSFNLEIQGQQWGVLVADSRLPDDIGPAMYNTLLFTRYIDIMGKIVEKA